MNLPLGARTLGPAVDEFTSAFSGSRLEITVAKDKLGERLTFVTDMN